MATYCSYMAIKVTGSDDMYTHISSLTINCFDIYKYNPCSYIIHNRRRHDIPGSLFNAKYTDHVVCVYYISCFHELISMGHMRI